MTIALSVSEPARLPLPAAPAVHVVGGFLGSGKTTLLKRLLAHEIARGVRPAVVMNEYGERNVDSRLLHDHAGDDLEMRELLNGCVCCDLSDDLSNAIRKLLRNPSRPIFVETTGLADVRQVADAVAAVRFGGPGGSHLDPHVVVVVDAYRWREGGGADPVLAGDVRAADVVVVNKTDAVGGRALSALMSRIRAANPRARVLPSRFGNVDPRVVLETAERRPPAKRSRLSARPPADSSRGFASVTCSVKGRVRLPRLRALLTGYGRRIARLKGFIQVVGRSGIQEVQWVPGALEVRPFAARRRRARVDEHLIIIGRRIDWNRFFEATTRCVAPAAAARR